MIMGGAMNHDAKAMTAWEDDTFNWECDVGFYPTTYKLKCLKRRFPKIAAVLSSCGDRWAFYQLTNACGFSEKDIYRRSSYGLQLMFAEIRRQTAEHGAWRCGHPKVPENSKRDGPGRGMRCRACRGASNRRYELGKGRATRLGYRMTNGFLKRWEYARLRAASGRGAEESRMYRARKEAYIERLHGGEPSQITGQKFHGKFYPFPGQEW